MRNIFQRTNLLLGPDAVDVLSKSHVAIFGLGGVGSFAAESLVRSGIGEITLIDFDTVGETNINRQSLAFTDTISMPKVDLMETRAKRINENCIVNKHAEFFAEDTSDRLLSKNYDAVIDAIDSFNPKIHLITQCLGMNIPIFAAMGAAGKIDPSQVRVADISKTTICPLAKRIRKKLRSFGISEGFKVAYSIEPPILPFDPKLIPENKREETMQRGRLRLVQGTISYMPAIFGLTLSGMVIQHLTGFQTARETPDFRVKLDKLYKD